MKRAYIQLLCELLAVTFRGVYISKTICPKLIFLHLYLSDGPTKLIRNSFFKVTLQTKLE